MVVEVNTGGLKRFVYSSEGNLIRRLRPREDKVPIKIVVANILGKPKEKVILEMTRIDDNFYDKVLSKTGKKNNRNKLIFKKVTDKDGKIKFDDLLNGTYLARFSKGKSFFEKIIIIAGKQEITIKTPLFFGIIKKELDREEVKEIFEETRSDKKYCSKCDGEYQGIPDKFHCPYCGKNYCGDHHLPEDHNCRGLK
jgi:5-hydroxyisourate hydrolase-like protein (transthyretin family)